MRRLSLLLTLALTGCATALPQVVEREGDVFDVRFDAPAQSAADADAVANAHCAQGAAGFVSEQVGFDGLSYRTYRCAFR